MVSFCFHLSVGNMDEAFRAIKMITNKKIWGNLGRMCVKSQVRNSTFSTIVPLNYFLICCFFLLKRLDVATICLGKMEHATGARAMRKIMGSKVSKDIKIAILAIYLKVIMISVNKK